MSELTPEQFTFFWNRRPTCKCEQRTKMTLEKLSTGENVYQCHHCGLIVNLKAAGADLMKTHNNGEMAEVLVSKSHK